MVSKILWPLLLGKSIQEKFSFPLKIEKQQYCSIETEHKHSAKGYHTELEYKAIPPETKQN